MIRKQDILDRADVVALLEEVHARHYPAYPAG